MSEEKETIFLRVSPELKRAVKIAATLEHRKMANFVEAVLLENPKVKEALGQEEQEGSKNLENNEKEEKESLKQEKRKKNVQMPEKKEKEVHLEGLKHNF